MNNENKDFLNFQAQKQYRFSAKTVKPFKIMDVYKVSGESSN
jgi:hypothetical protein